jgi:DNA repair protein RadC
MENVNKTSTSMKHWAVDEQPDKKMILYGASYLSNAELIAILLRAGNRHSSAIELAKEMLHMSGNDLGLLGKKSITELQGIKGIGETKSIVIAAALEIGKRSSLTIPLEKIQIKSSQDVAQFLQQQLKHLSYEVFAVLFLNRANKIIRFEIVSKGGITSTIADPRIILKQAILHGATSIIISHNHPSGSLIPSNADNELTKKIKTAAALLDISLLDHIIVSDEGYLSYLDEGLL